eukprot:1152555-Amorphochlora_amoeboformis.AAC.2
MGRKGKDKQLQITDVLKATGDYLKAVEKGKEKAECAKQFDREMQRLHAQFEFLDRLTENVELPREIQSQIEEIHMDCKSFNKTFNVIEERMDSEKTTFVSWVRRLPFIPFYTLTVSSSDSFVETRCPLPRACAYVLLSHDVNTGDSNIVARNRDIPPRENP